MLTLVEGLYAAWDPYFEEVAIDDFEHWCASDEAFDWLAHMVAVSAVAEVQDRLTQVQFDAAIRLLHRWLLAGQPCA